MSPPMYGRLPRLLTRCLTSSKSTDFPPTREDELLAVDGQSRSQLPNRRQSTTRDQSHACVYEDAV
jgi:hypothetical protein